MNTTPMKLTEEERTTIVNALTVAARQYEIDAERASELALHGMTIFEPARGLAKQFQDLATDARQLRDKITFFGSTFSFELWRPAVAVFRHPGQSMTQPSVLHRPG